MLRPLLGAALLAACTSTGALALDDINLGGTAKGDPSVVWYQFQGDDNVAVFVRGPGNLMYARVGDQSGTDWTNWTAIGNQALKGSPSCVATKSTLIDCVGVGTDNTVWHIAYNANQHQWTNWKSLGGFATSDPSAVRTIDNGDRALNIFVRGPNNDLFLNAFEGGSWSGWQNLDVSFGGTPGCTDIFVLGAHCYDTSGGGAKQYSDLTRETGANVFIDNLGGAIQGKASGVATGNGGDTLRVFVHGPGHKLWFKKWHGGWSNWEQLPASVHSAPGCAMKKSGGRAFCATVESDGSVKMIMIKNSEL